MVKNGYTKSKEEKQMYYDKERFEFEFESNDTSEPSNELSGSELEEIWDMLYELEDALGGDGIYFSLTNQEDEKNLFKKVAEYKYACFLAALLKFGSFDEDFTLIDLPKESVIIEEAEEIGKKIPKLIEIKGEIFDIPDGAGIQYATYNFQTREITYTNYTIRDARMFNAVHGKGKVPITELGMLDMDKHVPV